MSTPLDQFIDAMERRKKQLEELVESYRIFRSKLDSLPPELAAEAHQMLAESSSMKEPSPMQDMIGETALNCANHILAEGHNAPLHFAEIAKQAIKRGYRGRAAGTPSEVEQRTIQSFWAALHRSEHFEPTGKGCYRIREGHDGRPEKT
jgi:hypothetical protein